MRHAAASTIIVSLACEGPCLDLTISDDGTGFDVESAADSGRGFGLLSMRERAVLSHGEFEISSVIGGGTTVHVTIPLGT